MILYLMEYDTSNAYFTKSFVNLIPKLVKWNNNTCTYQRKPCKYMDITPVRLHWPFKMINFPCFQFYSKSQIFWGKISQFWSKIMYGILCHDLSIEFFKLWSKDNVKYALKLCFQLQVCLKILCYISSI